MIRGDPRETLRNAIPSTFLKSHGKHSAQNIMDGDEGMDEEGDPFSPLCTTHAHNPFFLSGGGGGGRVDPPG